MCQVCEALIPVKNQVSHVCEGLVRVKNQVCQISEGLDRVKIQVGKSACSCGHVGFGIDWF